MLAHNFPPEFARCHAAPVHHHAMHAVSQAHRIVDVVRAGKLAKGRGIVRGSRAALE